MRNSHCRHTLLKSDPENASPCKKVATEFKDGLEKGACCDAAESSVEDKDMADGGLDGVVEDPGGVRTPKPPQQGKEAAKKFLTKVKLGLRLLRKEIEVNPIEQKLFISRNNSDNYEEKLGALKREIAGFVKGLTMNSKKLLWIANHVSLCITAIQRIRRGYIGLAIVDRNDLGHQDIDMDEYEQ